MSERLETLSTLFDVVYGINLELNKMEICDATNPNAINFVSRTDKNNGVAARVKKIENITPNPANTISVAGGGSVLASFLQPEPYYSGRDLYVLIPKRKMSESEMLFYCHCIRKNRFKYNYGRQANKTLKSILLPAVAPKWVLEVDYTPPIPNPIIDSEFDLSTKDWKSFTLSDLFDIERGRGPRLYELTEEDNFPFVTSSDQNNGWSGGAPYSVHQGNVISVARNGSVGEAFYQPVPFASTEDVHIFNPKFPMNVYIGLFFVTILRREKYRYNYGRKWGLQRMNETSIKLPATPTNKPDFLFMENYIKSLPYSAALATGVTKVISIKTPTYKKPEKGLSDEELVKKYENGSVDFGNALKPILTNPKK